ncbi:MAG TPA: hypothetical protein VLS89_00280, partial [Candidatus Nanopelagicales bacterium]|nr:hypothetical protein [Candidatus Nanopelagicales bacterium]
HKLARIRALASEPAQIAAAELRRFLEDTNGYLVGEAAKVVADLELSALAPDLANALLRLIKAPMEADKGCHGKKGLAQALIALDASAPEAYLAGLRHVQPEPAFGEPIDTASSLRGLCAHALVRMEHPGAALDVAPLLFDKEPDTRAGAADALASTGEPLIAAALHVKVLAGDKEPEVLGACYKGLLSLDARRYLPLVAEALADGEEIAALALGESRLPEALGALKAGLEGASVRLAESVMLGIALLRSDEANAFLVERVAKGPEGQAAAAIGGLALHRHDERLMQQAREAAEKRGAKKILRVVEEKLGA